MGYDFRKITTEQIHIEREEVGTLKTHSHSHTQRVQRKKGTR